MENIDFRLINTANPKSLIDTVCEHLGFPETTFLGTRITKKMLMDHNYFIGSDQKIITNVIQSIVWQNTLKPETLNIPSFVTDTLEYLEIAVIRVELKCDPEHKSKLKHIAKLLHTAIPYPLILLIELEGELAISLADKRINQADKTKLVIEHIYSSDWFNSQKLTESENHFLNDFSFKNASNLNYFELYYDLISMLIGLEASKISGYYASKTINIMNHSLLLGGNHKTQDFRYRSTFAEKSNHDKTTILRELEGLEVQLVSIRSRLKKETQMNEKLRFNLEAKKIKQKIADIQSQL